MAKRFGRNQKRKLLDQLRVAQSAEITARRKLDAAQKALVNALREQLSKGHIPLEVGHFLSREGRSIVMHAIFDERRSNLHYQHELSDREVMVQRDQSERERLGQYLGRAIADRIADAYAGKKDGSSKVPG